MPTYGGYSSQPERYGGGNRRFRRILESLNKARGTAFDVTVSSVVYAENYCIAKMIDGMWAASQRLANQFDPNRMTTLLPRWERILGITPFPTDTMVDRRARIANIFSAFSRLASISIITSQLTTALGNAFVQVDTISPSVALSWWPGGNTNAASPWYSTVAHLLIRTQTPAGWSEAQYQAAISKVAPILEPLLPAWVTWDVYRPGTNFVNVAGGPSAGGFYLDDPHNLDNEVMDV